MVAVGRAAATSVGFPIMVAAAAPAAAEGCRGVVPVAAGAEAVYTRTPLPRTTVTVAADRVAPRAVTTYTPLLRMCGMEDAPGGGLFDGVMLRERCLRRRRRA